MILLLKVCGDGQEGSYECYSQDWYFYASLVAGNLKISEIYNANKQFSRIRQLFMSSEFKKSESLQCPKKKFIFLTGKSYLNFSFAVCFWCHHHISLFWWSRNFEGQINQGQTQEMGSPQEVCRRKNRPAQDLQETCSYSIANTVFNH